MKPDLPWDDQAAPSGAPLTKPNAKMKLRGSSSRLTQEEIRGLLANPIYAGLGPYPPLVSDEQWVRSAVKAIREEGPEQFLVNMLHVLRLSFRDATLNP